MTDKIKQLKKLVRPRATFFLCSTAEKRHLLKALLPAWNQSVQTEKKRGEINGVQHLGLKSVIRWSTGVILAAVWSGDK